MTKMPPRRQPRRDRFASTTLSTAGFSAGRRPGGGAAQLWPAVDGGQRPHSLVGGRSAQPRHLSTAFGLVQLLALHPWPDFFLVAALAGPELAPTGPPSGRHEHRDRLGV